MSEIAFNLGLIKWAAKKFVERCSTMEMMASVDSQQDIEAIAIVALLEVDPAVRYAGMDDSEAAFIKSCHQHLNNVLHQAGWPRLPAHTAAAATERYSVL